jgi:hypothetical protein
VNSHDVSKALDQENSMNLIHESCGYDCGKKPFREANHLENKAWEQIDQKMTNQLQV